MAYGYCVHFNGTMNDHCRKGHEYISFNDGTRTGIAATLPCAPDRRQDKRCPDRRFPTAEERAEEKQREQELLQRFFDDLEHDRCPHCQMSIDTWQQVGRCVYANPCGHRLYQGRVPKGKPTAP